MKYKHIFFDLDHTLWDFDANARSTLEQIHTDMKLGDRGINDFERFYTNYLAHNEKLWNRYRKGYIRQEELRLKRMRLSLLDFRIADDTLARQMSDVFLELLPRCTLTFPGALDVLQYLAGKNYGLHLITNGFETVQRNKLDSCGLLPFFDVIVTSESSNSLKPQPAIFEYALTRAGARREESVMIGDNLEVDIAGAMGVGMDQVHVNFSGAAQDIQPTYTIRHLDELKQIF